MRAELRGGEWVSWTVTRRSRNGMHLTTRRPEIHKLLCSAEPRRCRWERLPQVTLQDVTHVTSMSRSNSNSSTLSYFTQGRCETSLHVTTFYVSYRITQSLKLLNKGVARNANKLNLFVICLVSMQSKECQLQITSKKLLCVWNGFKILTDLQVSSFTLIILKFTIPFF